MTTHFNTLLAGARQRVGERLLFTFARAEQPEAAASSLQPVMCLDRDVKEIDSFEAIAREAQQFAHEWHIVFVASLEPGRPAEAPLRQMISAIQTGRASSFPAFNHHGELLALS